MAEHHHAKNERPDIPGLEQIEERYTRWQGEEPPALIDQAVINLAHRHVEARERKRRRTLHWISGLSTAALMVLALSLVMQSRPGPPAPAIHKDEVMAPAPLRQKRSMQDAPSIESKSTAQPETFGMPAETEQDSDLAREELGAEARMEALPAEESTDSNFREAILAPEVWLEQIRQLRQQGQADEADAELLKFRAAYPDFPLPPDLQG